MLRSRSVQSCLPEIENESQALTPVTRKRVKLARFWHDWIPIVLIILMVVALSEVGKAFLMEPVFDDSSAWLWWTRLCVFEIVVNVISIRLTYKKDNVHHQLERLGIRNLNKLVQQEIINGRDKLIKSVKYCIACERYVPVRSVHCNLCGICNLRIDHHCFAMSTCIGVMTLRYFVVFGFWMMCLGFTGAYAYLTFYLPDEDESLSAYLSVFYDMLLTHALGAKWIIWWSEGYVPNVFYLILFVVWVGSVTCLTTGLVIFFGQLLLCYRGLAMGEYFQFNKEFRGEGGSFYSRFCFIFGSKWYISFFFPLIWHDVEWTPDTKQTLIYSPLKELPKEETI